MNLSAYPVIGLLVVSMLACLMTGIFKNCYCKSMASTAAGFFLYSAVTSAVCAALLFVLSGCTLEVSLYTVLLSLLFGVATVAGTVLSAAALRLGPWSYTSVIGSFSTVISALSGYFFWEEELGARKLGGILLMFFCFVFSVKTEKQKQAATVRWLILAILSSLATAGIGILQKVHQHSAYRDELMPFLMISFLFSFLVSLMLCLVTRRHGQKTDRQGSGRSIWLLVALFAVSGVCIALNNVFNLYLVGVMESAVFFPIVNGGALMLNILAGLLLFRERLTGRQWIGIACGVTATFLLCI